MTALVLNTSFSPVAPCVGDDVTACIELRAPVPLAHEGAERGIAVPIPSGNTPFPAITIKDARINTASAQGRSGQSGAVLTVHFTPWEAAELFLPPFDLSSLTGGSEPLFTPPIPVEVASVFPAAALEKELRPPLPPLLSPLTVHTLYALFAAIIALLSLCFVIAAKRNRIFQWFCIRRMNYKEKRNVKALRRRLAALEKSRAGDAAFCTGLQKSIREYLGERFGEDFSVLTTREVSAVCASRIEGVASLKAEDAYDALSAVMRRTDYVRFSRSESLELRERTRLISEVAAAVSAIESAASCASPLQA